MNRMLAGIGAAVLLARVWDVSWAGDLTLVDARLAGGGVTTGGAFTVRGSIGPVDTGRMAGGAFAVADGGHAGVMTGIPFFWIKVVRGQVQLEWSGPARGWSLQETGTLLGAPPPWTPALTGVCRTNATTVTYVSENTLNPCFFRLIKTSGGD